VNLLRLVADTVYLAHLEASMPRDGVGLEPLGLGATQNVHYGIHYTIYAHFLLN